ncbi:MAG: hypothetical protein U5J62_07350 [Desulfurivibrio sp.]|nr:hypothetical protein [Desulfurivibrio sp.]
MLTDAYGIFTSQGAGRRVANTAKLLAEGRSMRLKDKLKVGFLLLQDAGKKGKKEVDNLVDRFGDRIEAHIFDLTEEKIVPCKGCKYCPAKFGADDEYRCVVNDETDFFYRNHQRIVGLDAFVVVIYSASDKGMLQATYQRFIERTRYLRRSDYIYSNIPFVPLVFEEVGAGQNFHIRIITSFIRHETIVLQPLIGVPYEGVLLNRDDVYGRFEVFLDKAEVVAVGRMASSLNNSCHFLYNPVGYVLKYGRDVDEKITSIRHANLERRCHLLQSNFSERLIQKSTF